MNGKRPLRVLYVCSGNICRSPLAQGVSEHLIGEVPGDGTIHFESRGTTGYHVGEQVDPRMRETAASRGIRLSHRARQMSLQDFEDYDLILAMDQSNYRDLMRMAREPDHQAKIRMFREYDPEAKGDLEVPDPWYGGMKGFERVFEIVHRTCAGLIAGERDPVGATASD
ncbi:MAG: low molecular weight protein-tyrosine-phosphatase [Spirochaetota bacterium]